MKHLLQLAFTRPSFSSRLLRTPVSDSASANSSKRCFEFDDRMRCCAADMAAWCLGIVSWWGVFSESHRCRRESVPGIEYVGLKRHVRFTVITTFFEVETPAGGINSLRPWCEWQKRNISAPTSRRALERWGLKVLCGRMKRGKGNDLTT